MNGPEHCREAERLLDVANDRHADADDEGGYLFTRQAQVHATLAAAAEQCGRSEFERTAILQADQLDKLRAAVRKYLDELRVGHKGGSQLAAMRVLVEGA